MLANDLPILPAFQPGGIGPEPPIPVSDWADLHHILPPTSAEPGRWRIDRTPYLRAVMDTLSTSSSYERVELARLYHPERPRHRHAGHALARHGAARHDRADCSPNRSHACPARSGLSPRSRDAGNSLFRKSVPGGQLLMTGANSAVGLATGGLDHAEHHFRQVMAALDIPYGEHQMRVSRVDFAVDMLAPWFEPDRNALVAPPGTKAEEYTGIDETATQATGSRVTGIRAGAFDNRQLAIYDKRAEVIQKAKDGWLAIWNAERAACGQAPLDLTDRTTSQVWRFELRLGSKQLRNRFEMHTWQDLRDTLGDAFHDALGRLRYCIPTADSNRARWPVHELWRLFEDTIEQDLSCYCSGVQPSDVLFANRIAKMRELDRQILGLFITRAAISDVPPGDFYSFMEIHVDALQRASEEHPKTLDERLQKAGGRYRWT